MQELVPDEQGRLFSNELDCWLKPDEDYLRLIDRQGQPLPGLMEISEQARLEIEQARRQQEIADRRAQREIRLRQRAEQQAQKAELEAQREAELRQQFEQQAAQLRQQAEQQAQQLEEQTRQTRLRDDKLRAMGIDPDTL